MDLLEEMPWVSQSLPLPVWQHWWMMLESLVELVLLWRPLAVHLHADRGDAWPCPLAIILHLLVAHLCRLLGAPNPASMMGEVSLPCLNHLE